MFSFAEMYLEACISNEPMCKNNEHSLCCGLTKKVDMLNRSEINWSSFDSATGIFRTNHQANGLIVASTY